MTNKITQKYDDRADQINSLLCVGLDADFEKIPKRFKILEHPQFEFNKYIIEATHEYTAAYKPNSAFYEARGDAGIRELKMTLDYLRENFSDIFTIFDAKRADIGNTNHGYVDQIFNWLGFDALTLHPYLGSEAIEPFLERKDKISIILCRTSNPGAAEIQDLLCDGKPVWFIVAEKVLKSWNRHHNCFLVVGATYPSEMKRIREIAGDMIFLVPGIGAQGGDIEASVKAGLNAAGKGMIISSSRQIIFSDDPGLEARKLRDAINAHR